MSGTRVKSGVLERIGLPTGKSAGRRHICCSTKDYLSARNVCRVVVWKNLPYHMVWWEE
jgi:hypothetical protein